MWGQPLEIARTAEAWIDTGHPEIKTQTGGQHDDKALGATIDLQVVLHDPVRIRCADLAHRANSRWQRV